MSTTNDSHTDRTAGSAWRGDIEGLRAVAILGVVADHAGLPFAEGGFVGVDVFFVLSGFLITGLLVQELRTAGSINFVAFYGRRLQRLLPALALMLVVASLAAAVLLAPHEQLPQAATAPLAFLWLSNFHFALADFAYFDAGSETNIYLHTWSLGVEEQFYLLWPLLLLALFAARKGTPQRSDARLRQGLAWSLLAGIALSLLLTYAEPLWAFYSMPSRIWQFALGGLLLLHVDARRLAAAQGTPVRSYSPALQAWAGWCGAAMMIGSMLFLHARLAYPGVWAVFPSVGAALVLFAGTGAGWRRYSFSRVLAAAPLRFIGAISYSWYLWHWPVLILGEALRPDAGVGYQCLLVAVSLLLAIAAYYLVESPVRHSLWLRARPAATVAGALVLMAGGALAGPIWRDAAAAWTALPAQSAYTAIRGDLPQIYAMGCDDWYSSARVRACSFGPQGATSTVVLFGDSVGLQWFSALAAQYLQAGARVIVLTKSSCPMVDEPIFYPRIGAEYVVCEQWRNAALNFLGELRPDIVFIGSTATYAYSPEQWREGTARILGLLSSAAQRIYLIRGTPRLPFDGPGCLARRDWQPDFLAMDSACSAPASPDVDVTAALKEAVQRFDNARFLDLNPLLCIDGICQAEVGGNVVFRDEQHVANRYVIALQQQIAEAIAAVD